MFEKVCHIGPALDVQGGISSVLVSYKNLFDLPDDKFIPSYNGSFVKSLPLLFCLCLKLLLNPPDAPYFQIHTSFNGSFFRKFLISLCLRIRLVRGISLRYPVPHFAQSSSAFYPKLL